MDRTRGDLKKMPDRCTRLAVDRDFTAKELDLIKAGPPLATMDHRWVTRSEGDWVHFHYRWTGCCIYSIKFMPHLGGFRVCEVIANRDPAQNRELDDERDARWLNWIIDRLILGKDVESPAHEDARRRDVSGE